jgi:hypothetical protein
VAEVTDMMYVFGDAHIRNGTGEAAALMESVVRDYILNLVPPPSTRATHAHAHTHGTHAQHARTTRTTRHAPDT